MIATLDSNSASESHDNDNNFCSSGSCYFHKNNVDNNNDNGYDNASENYYDNDKNKNRKDDYYIVSYIIIPFIMLTKMTSRLILNKSFICNNNREKDKNI